jgi:hypothetical protein
MTWEVCHPPQAQVGGPALQAPGRRTWLPTALSGTDLLLPAHPSRPLKFTDSSPSSWATRLPQPAIEPPNPPHTLLFLLLPDVTPCQGPEFHGLFAELLGNGIFNVDGEAWRLQRKVASHEFSTKSLKELMLSTFTRKVNGALLPLVGELAEKGTPFDLQVGAP